MVERLAAFGHVEYLKVSKAPEKNEQTKATMLLSDKNSIRGEQLRVQKLIRKYTNNAQNNCKNESNSIKKSQNPVAKRTRTPKQQNIQRAICVTNFRRNFKHKLKPRSKKINQGSDPNPKMDQNRLG